MYTIILFFLTTGRELFILGMYHKGGVTDNIAFVRE